MRNYKFAYFESHIALSSWANNVDPDFLLVDIPSSPYHAERLELILAAQFKVLPVLVDSSKQFLCLPIS